MRLLISESKKFFSTDRAQAEAIITEAKEKHQNSIKKHSITRRTKITKEEIIEFYIVDITIEHVTVQEIFQ